MNGFNWIHFQQGSLSLFKILEGRIRYGRFGHAMAKLGDINGDKYEGLL